MEYEVKEGAGDLFDDLGYWVVTAIDHDGLGDIYMAFFYSHDAEQRAREYADWMNDRVR